MPIIAKFLTPLIKKLQKNEPSTFQALNDKGLESVQSQIKAAILQTVSGLSYSVGHVTLDADACNVQVGCDFHKNNLTRRLGKYSIGQDRLTILTVDITPHKESFVLASGPCFYYAHFLENARFTIKMVRASLN